jgi:hypothetical protein
MSKKKQSNVLIILLKAFTTSLNWNYAYLLVISELKTNKSIHIFTLKSHKKLLIEQTNNKYKKPMSNLRMLLRLIKS